MAEYRITEQHVYLDAAFHAPNGFIHEGHVEANKFPENNALKAAAEALGFARSEAESINELRTDPHEEHLPAQHDRVVRERCDAFHGKLNEKIDNANAGLVRELANVEAGILAKAGLTSNPAHFDAITSAFHMMAPGKRAETVAELVKQGDHASLATLIEAPLFLTGLTAVQRDGIKEQVFHKVDPMAVALRDHLKVVIERFGKAMNASPEMLNRLRSGTAPGEWKTRAQQAAARNAANAR